jgi:hypothetical protein
VKKRVILELELGYVVDCMFGVFNLQVEGGAKIM